MKTQKENQVSKILNTIKKRTDKRDITESDIIFLINEVHVLITEDCRKKLLKSNAKYTIEDYENYADMIVDLSDMVVLSILRTYSLDTSSISYKISDETLKKLKRYLSGVLSSKKENASTEIYSWLFFFSYLIPVKNATKNRKEVLLERSKKKSK